MIRVDQHTRTVGDTTCDLCEGTIPQGTRYDVKTWLHKGIRRPAFGRLFAHTDCARRDGWGRYAPRAASARA